MSGANPKGMVSIEQASWIMEALVKALEVWETAELEPVRQPCSAATILLKERQ